MWYAWDEDGLLYHYEKENNCKYEIEFKTKKDVLWEASCNYEDGRKRPTVKRIAQGWYEYSPKDCDGQWRSDITIVNKQCLDKYNLRDTFNESLEQFNEDLKENY